MKQLQTIRKEQNINLIKDLINKGLSRNEILNELKWSSKQLTNFAYNHKIIIPKYNNIFPNEEQTQVIIGSLLGDGCISTSGKYSKTCRLQISHSIKQLDYLKYKYTILENLCNSGIRYRKRIDKRFKNPEYIQCEIKTKSLKVFSNYRYRWYPNNKKELGISNIWDLKSLGLAIWFMDDGTKNSKSASFATQSFSIEDILLIQHVLLKKFNIETTIQKDKTLRIRQKSYESFINLIKPHMINSMLYKIASTKSDKLLGTPEVDNQQPI